MNELFHAPDRFRARDTRYLPFPARAIWPVLTDLGAYRRWWPRVLLLRVRRITPGIVGGELTIRPLGGIAFGCRVTELVPCSRMWLEYGGYWLEGGASWGLEPAGQATWVSYTVDLRVKRRLLAYAQAAGALHGIHRLSMRLLFQGLTAELGRR